MSAITIQRGIGAVFLILGGWCLLAPASVIALTIRPEYQSNDPLLLLTLGAFGAQAVLAGLFAAFSRFTRTTFLVFGLALLPFFVFDYWFYFVEPIFNELILLDVIGNVIMLALCFVGYRKLAATP
jgi:hypothetical protein